MSAVTDAAAAAILSARKIVVLSGAGMSTAAGIPDFRSPDGLYANTQTLLDRFTYLDSSDCRESVAQQRAALESNVRNALTLECFSVNPLPYHEMRRGLIIGLAEGQWKLTIAHVLPELLNRKGKLLLLASQNIDGLDHKVVSNKAKLYNPHGLMSTLVYEGAENNGRSTMLATELEDPVYQRYISLVKSQIKDIYTDKSKREGCSNHLWPAPSVSTPITLASLGDALPTAFHPLREREKERPGTYSLKPGSVLFDCCLWQQNAAGDWCDAFALVEDKIADLVLVMGTSLSGLTIDGIAHDAGRVGTPRIVFDRDTKPVDSIKARGPWRDGVDGVDTFLQGPLDASVLGLLAKLGWLGLLYDYLPHLCKGSLEELKRFVGQDAVSSLSQMLPDGHEAALDAAIAHEAQREEAFYG